MPTNEQPRDKLRKLIRRRRIVELQDLCTLLGTQSRMTVFRRLREVSYLTSYTHRGRCYTLTEVPSFDDWGLWFHGDIGFSRAGTLKETVAVQVEEACDGRTHAELSRLLRVRVHNTLLDLVRQGRIGREPCEGSFLYVSAENERAIEQQRRRRDANRTLVEALRAPSGEQTVEILVEALRGSVQIPSPLEVATRLAARRISVESSHVEQVYETHGLQPGKKTVPRT